MRYIVISIFSHIILFTLVLVVLYYNSKDCCNKEPLTRNGSTLEFVQLTKSVKQISSTNSVVNYNNDNTKEALLPQPSNTSNGIRVIENQYLHDLKYSILKTSEPEYPIAAIRARYKKEVIIKTRVLVNEDGIIEKIEFLDVQDKQIEKLGFKESIEKSYANWRFSQFMLDNNVVKVYFYKDFKFTAY